MLNELSFKKICSFSVNYGQRKRDVITLRIQKFNVQKGQQPTQRTENRTSMVFITAYKKATRG